MGSLEEQKRLILPFLQRATEIEKHDPKVAYYCRLYAVEQGLAIPNRDPKINGILTALLAKLEKDKTVANLAGSEEDKYYIEDFALKVFARADKVDRAGLADKKTAVTFLAAFYFLEVLNQFGELHPDLIAKQKYAAWKAADINKAIREGRNPTPGPPVESTSEFDQGIDASGPSQDDFGLPSPPPLDHQQFPPEPRPSSAPEPPPAPPTDYPPAHTSQPLHPHLPPPAAAFSPGSRVWYSEDCGPSGVVKGTVAALEHTEGGVLFAVALSDRIVRVPEQHLVHELQPGDRVLYMNANPPVEVTVEAVDASHWPVSYVISFQEGGERGVSAEHLTPAATISWQGRGGAVGAPPPSMPAPPSMPVDVPQGGYISPPSTDASPPHYPLEPSTSPTPPLAPPSLPTLPHQHMTDPTQGRSGGSFTNNYNVPSLHPHNTPSGASPPQYYGGPPPHPGYPTPPQHPTSLSTSPPGTSPNQSSSSMGSGVLLNPVPGFKPGLTAITESQKHAKYAASSLSFEDVSTAVKHLTTALKLLTQPSNGQ